MAEKNILRGVVFIIFSSFCFALMGMFVHLAGPVPFIQKTFFRNIIALALALAAFFHHLRASGGHFSLPKGSFKYLLLRAAAGSAGIFGNFYALDRINIADASMLNKMSPFFAVIFSIVLLGEKIKPVPAVAIAGAFAGALLVIKPSFNFTQTLPALAGFIGGIGAGLAYACVRKLGSMKADGLFIIVFFSAFSSLLAVPYFAVCGIAPMTVSQTVFLLCAGAAAAGGQFCITTAYYAAPAADISIYDYSQIIFSALLGWFVFGQIPDLLSAAGYAVIIGMALVVFFYNRKQVN